MTTEPEHVARHESGHAVAAWALDVPQLRVTLTGRCWQPVPGVRRLVGQDWLIGAAGCIAEYTGRSLMLRDDQAAKLILGGTDDVITYDNPVTGISERGRRSPAVRRGADLHSIVTVMAGPDWPAGRCVAAWRSFERFVADWRPAVDAVTAALLERRKLTSGQVAEVAAGAMSGRPAPVIPAWARRLA